MSGGPREIARPQSFQADEGDEDDDGDGDDDDDDDGGGGAWMILFHRGPPR